jgi:type IV pilus assembly protein PilB
VRADFPAPGGARRRRGNTQVAEQVEGWPPLANALLAGRGIPKTTIEAAVNQSDQTGENLASVLFSMGVSENEIVRATAETMGLKFVDLDKYSLNAKATTLLPAKVVQQYNVLPIGWEFGTPVIAMVDPQNVMIKDELKTMLGRDFQPVLAAPSKIAEYAARMYGINMNTQGVAAAPVMEEVGDSIFATMFAQEVPPAPAPQVAVPPIAAPPPSAPPPIPVPETQGVPPMTNGSQSIEGVDSMAALSEPSNMDDGLDSYDEEDGDQNVGSYDLSSFTGGSILFEDSYGDEEDDMSVDLDYLSDLGLGDEEDEEAIPPLANSLIASGKVTPDQMEAALAQHRSTGKPLAQVLTEAGAVSELDLIQAMAKEIGLDFVDLSDYPIDEEQARRVPASLARRHRVLVIGAQGDTTLVAVANPSDMVAMDDLRTILGREFKPMVAAPSQIVEFIDKVYRVEAETESAAQEAAAVAAGEASGTEITNLETVVEDAPVIRFVNSILLQALNERASDVHVEPTEHDLRVRYRIDGVLHDFNRAPKNITSAVITRLKVMGELNIAEHRVPQDGRISLTAGNRKLDLRVATLPTVLGEKVVMRILDKSNALLSLEELGFYPDVLARYEEAYSKPYGTILVTGPTGSGKSTTLYSTLNILNSPDKHVVTVEDPVEYQIPGINQMNVNVKAGLTFASCLRSIMRGDPDIVLVGEIRDIETAHIAIEAALTGHLVLSSLHTNDAASTPMRLLEMGVEPFLVTSALKVVVNQRLARKLCTKCKEPYDASESELEVAGITEATMNMAKEVDLYRPVGCPACSKTGYRGRLSIAEVMLITEEVERLIIDRAQSAEIQRKAVEQGMIPMKQDGFRKALEGHTSIEEVLRVVV